MKAAQIAVGVAAAGGAIWVDGGHLKAKRIPAHLIPLIRAHKAALLALLDPDRPQPFVAPLPSDQCPDAYAHEERLAIQEEGSEISDLPDKPRLSVAEQAALVLDGYNGDRARAAADLRIVARNFALAETIERGLAPAEPPPGPFGVGTVTEHPDGSLLIQYLPAIETAKPPAPAPATVHCRDCARYQPGPQPLSIGVCLETTNGLPPKEQRGYLAAYPMAPRICNAYKELLP